MANNYTTTTTTNGNGLIGGGSGDTLFQQNLSSSIYALKWDDYQRSYEETGQAVGPMNIEASQAIASTTAVATGSGEGNCDDVSEHWLQNIEQQHHQAPLFQAHVNAAHAMGIGNGEGMIPGMNDNGGYTRMASGITHAQSTAFDGVNGYHNGPWPGGNYGLDGAMGGGNYGVEGSMGGTKRGPDVPEEKVLERRQKRMIKNRESAAKSRLRKQAYTEKLEAEVKQLKEENIKLRKEKDLETLRYPVRVNGKTKLRKTSSSTF